MKRYLFIILLAFVLSATNGLSQNAQGVIIGDTVPISNSFGECILVLQNDSTCEDSDMVRLCTDKVDDGYYIVDMLDVSNNQVLVNIIPVNGNDGSLSIDSVYVPVGNVGIGLSGSNYEGVVKLPIYDAPNYAARLRLSNIETESCIANVLQVDNAWIKICIPFNGAYLVGWIAPENQCVNMFSMCTGN